MNSTKYQALAILGIVIAGMVGIYWSIGPWAPREFGPQVEVVTDSGRTNLAEVNLFALVTNGHPLEVPTIPPQQIVR